MKRFIQRIIIGCGNLSDCGPHPGTESLFLICLFSGFAATMRSPGLIQFCIGVAISAVFFGPLYLIGAYDRAVFQEMLDRRKETPSDEH